jgi:4-amino-4-deoxy-L-arabinose transferase-like glycosyltransferase
MRKLPLLPYLTLLLWVLPLVFMQSAHQSLMAHDEGIYANQAKSILETGDWLTLQWGNQINFDRTIGIQWLIALSYRLFGINDAAARLPSQLAFISSVLLLYRIARLTLRSTHLAWLGAAVFAVMPIAVQYARLATQDSVLVMIELLAAWAMLESESGQPGQPTQHRSLLLLTGAALGWGFMIKGFMAIPAAIAFLPYLIGQFRQHQHWRNPWLYAGLAIGWIPVVGWLWAATQKYGLMPLQSLIFKVSYLGDHTHHDAGPFYYLWNIPANGFPWVFFAIGGLVLSLTNIHCHNRVRRHWGLLLGFPLLLFVELSLFKTRTNYYPLQLLPWLSLWSAIAIDYLLQLYRQQRYPRRIAAVSYGLGGLGLLALIFSGLVATDRLALMPGIQPADLPRVGMISLVLGLGWLGLLLTWLTRDRGDIFRSAKQWLVCLLLPVWLVLGMMGLTGLWGDYSSSLKAVIDDPRIAAITQGASIDFVVQPEPLTSGGRKRYLLLSYYTAHNGRHLRNWEPVEYAWVDPNLVTLIPPNQYEVLAEYYGWELVRHR